MKGESVVKGPFDNHRLRIVEPILGAFRERDKVGNRSRRQIVSQEAVEGSLAGRKRGIQTIGGWNRLELGTMEGRRNAQTQQQPEQVRHRRMQDSRSARKRQESR